MSKHVDSARLTRLSSISDDMIGRKLRVVGRVLCYDLGSATMLLENEGLAIAVDISLCLSSGGSLPWLVEARSVVTVFAYLERPPQSAPRSPALPSRIPPPTMIPRLQLQAILVLHSPDLDMRLWNETVTEMETIDVQAGGAIA